MNTGLMFLVGSIAGWLSSGIGFLAGIMVGGASAVVGWICGIPGAAAGALIGRILSSDHTTVSGMAGLGAITGNIVGMVVGFNAGYAMLTDTDTAQKPASPAAIERERQPAHPGASATPPAPNPDLPFPVAPGNMPGNMHSPDVLQPHHHQEGSALPAQPAERMMALVPGAEPSTETNDTAASIAGSPRIAGQAMMAPAVRQLPVLRAG